MTPRVIDTGVIVVGGYGTIDESAPEECIEECISALDTAMSDGRVVMDQAGEILDGYLDYLDRRAATPRDRFLIWVLQHQVDRWDVISTTPHKERCYAEFPSDPELATFDRSDRKFVAASRAHPDRPPILVAVDTDWWDARKALRRHNVRLEFLCEAELRATAGQRSVRRQVRAS